MNRPRPSHIYINVVVQSNRFEFLSVKPQFFWGYVRCFTAFVHLTMIPSAIYVEAAWCYLQSSPRQAAKMPLREVGIQRDQYRTAAKVSAEP